MTKERVEPTRLWYAYTDSADVVEVDAYQRSDIGYWVPQFGVHGSLNHSLFFYREQAVIEVRQSIQNKIFNFQKLLAKANKL